MGAFRQAVEKMINDRVDNYITEQIEHYKKHEPQWFNDTFKADESVGFTQEDAFVDALEGTDIQGTEGFAYDCGFIAGLKAARDILNDM